MYAIAFGLLQNGIVHHAPSPTLASELERASGFRATQANVGDDTPGLPELLRFDPSEFRQGGTELHHTVRGTT